MNEPTIESLFARYVDQGDVDALGEVFDRAAPELLRVALHVVGRPEDADDLLQSTFLTALEKRARWQRSRPLLPWLIGILEKHGSELRRRRALRADPSAGALHRDETSRARRDPSGGAPHDDATPELHATFRETSEVFERALAEVPERYRAALLATFRDGRKAVELAEELGVAPGTVRMRVHRGLELLRRALPAGAAIGVALSAGTARGLEGVRAEIVRRGSELAPTAGGSALIAAGGGLIMKGLGLAAAIVIAIVAWTWSKAGDEGGAPFRAGEEQVAGADVVARPSERAETSVSRATADTARLVAAADPAARAEVDEGWKRALVGFSGRVVDAAGAPVPGVALELAELPHAAYTTSMLALLSSLKSGEHVVARGTTDAEGRFRLRGARRATLAMLCVDPGGPRGALRILDRAPAPGGVDDVGDVVLDASRVIRGRIVSPDGDPIAGARVVVLPQETARLGIAAALVLSPAQDLHNAVACAVIGPALPATELATLPRGLHELLDKLPCPTARAGADGSFEVALAHGRPAIVAIDAPHAAPAAMILADETDDLGAVVLWPTATAHGRLIDARGDPIAGARVLASAVREGLALFHGGALTDAGGRFTVEGLPHPALAFALQREGSTGWRIVRDVIGDAADGSVELRLDDGAAWTVRVRDETGRALAGARVRVATTIAALRGESNVPGGIVDARTDAEGVAVARDLAPGYYFASVEAPGFGESLVGQKVAQGGASTDIALMPLAEVEVAVVDAATSAPLAGVRATLESEGGERLALAFTDLAGRALLPWSQRGELRTTSLRVEHPAYGERVVARVSPEDVVRVALDAGGTLEAHVRSGAEPAAATLLLRSAEGSMLFARADAQGTARVTHLASGAWMVLATEPLEGVESIVEGSSRRPGFPPVACTISSGTTARIELQLALEPLRAPRGDATIEGVVRIDGAPAAELSVRWRVRRGTAWLPDEAAAGARTDADGRFRVARCPEGPIVLDLEKLDERGYVAFRGAHALVLAKGERRHLELDLRSARVPLRVLDAAGAPVADALVTLTPIGTASNVFGFGGVTDGRGRIDLSVSEENRYRVLARHDELGEAVAELDVRFDVARTPLELRLSEGVACRGVLVLDGFPSIVSRSRGARPEGSLVMLSVVRKGEAGSARFVEVQVVDGRGAFELHGLQPGEYVAGATLGQSFSSPIDFSLGPQGDLHLELRARLADLPQPAAGETLRASRHDAGG